MPLDFVNIIVKKILKHVSYTQRSVNIQFIKNWQCKNLCCKINVIWFLRASDSNGTMCKKMYN